MRQWQRWRMETIQCPWKPIRLIWIWDWGLLLSCFALYDLFLALLLRSPISLISLCSSLPDALPLPLFSFRSSSHPVVHYRSPSPKQISFHDGWALWTLVQKLCQIFSSRSKSWEAGGSLGDMRGIMGRGLWESRRGLGMGYLASFLSTPGSSCGWPGSDHKSHRGTTLEIFKNVSRSPSFPALTPSIFHMHYFNSLCGSPTSLMPCRKVLLFQHLNHYPLQHFSPHSILPSLFLPISFSLSVYDGQVSWGKTVGRMQACCHGNRNPPSPSGLLSNY